MTAKYAVHAAVAVLAVVAIVLGLTRDACAALPRTVLDRIDLCETGRLHDWARETRDYVGAYGMHRSAYTDGARHAGVPDWPATGHAPGWQQRAVALAVARAYGWSAWGCYRQYGWVRG